MFDLKENARVLFIGDSITDTKFNKRMKRKLGGYPNYPLQVAKELKKSGKKLKFFYRGIASNRSYHLYDRLTEDCISLNPDIIIMLIGVNDAWEHYVPEQYPPLLRPFKPHMEEIFRRIGAELPNAKLLVMTPFLIHTVPEKAPFQKFVNDYCSQLEELAAKYGYPTLSLQDIFDRAEQSTEPRLLATDGVHPTRSGHSLIAEAVLSQLNVT